jgi:hypothetical protein
MIMWDVAVRYGAEARSLIDSGEYPKTALEAVKYAEHVTHMLGIERDIVPFTSRQEAAEWLLGREHGIAVFPFDWNEEAWG